MGIAKRRRTSVRAHARKGSKGVKEHVRRTRREGKRVIKYSFRDNYAEVVRLKNGAFRVYVGNVISQARYNFSDQKDAVNFARHYIDTLDDIIYPIGYFKNRHPNLLFKAQEYGLDDIENEDLTAEGIIAKMREWDEDEHGVEAYVYDETKKDFKRLGRKMPADIRRRND